MPTVTDEDAALLAIATLDGLSEAQQQAQVKVASILHEKNGDPFVDINELFTLYDILYFRSLLQPRVEVSWSSRLTLCAGICELVKDDEGRHRRIRLKLSEPLLQYRPRSDTINTLLHEAIHAYFFITTSWQHSRGDDGTGHGTGFLLLADAISNHGTYEVTVYHTFHNEVDIFRTHVWKCNGKCQHQTPYFGIVKRSMNRAPSKSDSWWLQHQRECGGTYSKISEPALTKAQLIRLSAKDRAGRQENKIDNWVRHPDLFSLTGPNSTPSPRKQVADNGSPLLPKHSVDTQIDERKTQNVARTKRKRSEDSASSFPPSKTLGSCPVCNIKISETEINKHLDEEHFV